MRSRFLSGTLLLITVTAHGQQNPYNYTITKYLSPAKYAVVSAHPLASEAGVQVLRDGGNAVDAAIATQLALAVVYPQAGNLGGGGFLVAKLKGGKTIAIDYREMAPRQAHRDMYLDANGVVQTKKSLDGHLAAGVPGSVAGLFASHRHARLAFAKLVAPAIALAEKGFVITEAEAAGLNRRRDEFLRLNTTPTAFVKEAPWKAGDTLIQRDLARTLQLIADHGAKGFYEGETAAKIVAEMQRGGGIISAADLKGYMAKTRKPLQFKFAGYDVLTMPLPSSGGIGIQQMLGMVEPYPLATWGFHNPQSVQVMIEAERRAYADRAKFLGDPDFTSPPLGPLTSAGYLKFRMRNFTPGKASPNDSAKAGDFFTRTRESTQTTHLSVLDADGNAVSVTTTLNGSYGSKVVVGGAGFLLNNEMDDFSVKPGSPNMYGLIGAEANAIAPRKRMLSSMTPTIVLKGNQPVLITGTPGGSTIITSVFQTILNALVFNLDAQTNVNAPKFHHQGFPDEVKVEHDFPEATITALEKMGYKIVKSGPWSRTELIRIHPGGKIEAVGDKRGDDSAAGF